MLQLNMEKKLVIIIDFKCEMVDPFSPKGFDSNAADIEKKFKKLDKDAVLKDIERKNADKINCSDIDIELSIEY